LPSASSPARDLEALIDDRVLPFAVRDLGELVQTDHEIGLRLSAALAQLGEVARDR
jgi:hypothetical protein